MKILIFILILISTSSPQSFWKVDIFFNSGETTYAGGAKGDGVTDDYLALQTWIDSDTSATYTLPAGKTYLISQPLYMRTNSKLVINGELNIQKADTTHLIQDMLVGASSFFVYRPEIFSVGQWVGVTDTATAKSTSPPGYYWGWVDSITSVNLETGEITFARSSPTNDADSAIFNNRVHRLAVAGHCQSVIMIDSVTNVSITGSGTINGQGFTGTDWTDSKIKIHPLTNAAGLGENWKTGIGISIRGSRNITVKGTSITDRLAVRHSQMHNIAVTAANSDNYNSQNIVLENLRLYYPRMKNILARETDDIRIAHVLCDSTYKEDGIMFYANVTRARIDTCVIKNSKRAGLNWQLACDSLVVDSLTMLNNDGTGIAIAGKNAYLDSVSSNNDILIWNRFGTATDINFTNTWINSATESKIIWIVGKVDTVKFTNLNITNSTGTAIYIDSTTSCSSYGCNGGLGTNISFTNGGITNLTGTALQYTTGTGLTFTNFTGSTYAGAERIKASIDRTFEPTSTPPTGYQSDFSAGADNWGSGNGTVGGNKDGIFGYDNVLAFVPSTGNSTHNMYSLIPLLTTGTKFRITFQYYIPSDNPILARAYLFDGNGATVSGYYTTKDAWTTASTTYTNTADNIQFYTYSASSGTYIGTATDTFYVYNIKMSNIANWTTGGTHSYDTSTTFISAGSYSGKFVSTGVGDSTTNFVGLDTLRFTELVSGESYRFSIDAKSTTASTTMYVQIGNNTQTFLMPDNIWTKFNYDFTANSYTVKKKIKIWFNKSATVYFDTASLKKSS